MTLTSSQPYDYDLWHCINLYHTAFINAASSHVVNDDADDMNRPGQSLMLTVWSSSDMCHILCDMCHAGCTADHVWVPWAKVQRP